MTIVFFGNTKYSNIGLRIVHSAYPISLVITVPSSPVKFAADELNIKTIEIDKLDQPTIKKVSDLKADFLIVEDYGLILPKKLLDLPKYAPLNIHHSLLPKYRGPSPAPSAILAGEKISGVTIIKLSVEVDAGDILAQKEYVLSPYETTDSLLTKLNGMGGKLVVSVIKQYLEGLQKLVPQPVSPTPYTPHFTRETGYFDLNNPPTAEKLDRMIRAYYPWPGVWTKWKGKIVKFLPKSHPERSEGSLANARTLNKLRDSSASPQNDEYLLQMEGKKPISVKDFLNGYPDFPLKT